MQRLRLTALAAMKSWPNKDWAMNDKIFADICSLNQLVIKESIFPQKRIHKATWRSHDHVTMNQIDHISINKKFRRTWKDVRVHHKRNRLLIRPPSSDDDNKVTPHTGLLLKMFDNTTNIRQGTIWVSSKRRKWGQRSTSACLTDSSRYKTS